MFKKVFKVSFDRWYLAERAFGKLQRTENVEPYFPDGHTSKVFEVFGVLKEIIIDFTKRRNRKRVGDIYYPNDREKYITDLFKRKKLKKPTPLPRPVLPSGKTPSGGKTPTAPKVPIKTKSPWDRPRVIKRGMGLQVPASEIKLNTILVELSSKINVRDATIAAGVLIRIILERSVEYYINKNKIGYKGDKLHVQINRCANKMMQDVKITKKQLQQLQKMSNSEQLISAHTLNAWVHNPSYSPTPREVCTFWDNIYFFLVECWK